MENVNYEHSYISKRGCGNGHALNEDSYCMLTHSKNANCCSFFSMVADGIGGKERSEIASAYLKQSLAKWYQDKADSLYEHTTKEIMEMLDEEIRSCHAFLKYTAEQSGYSYGSTLTLLLIINSRYIVAQVGDSRAYLSYRGIIRPLTKDQTLYQKKVDLGEEIPKEKERKLRSTVLQCIGAGDLTPRYYEGSLPAEYEALVCTDGFYKKLHPEDLERFFLSKDFLQEKLQRTVSLLYDRGEKDDITAVVLKKAYKKVEDNGKKKRI